MEKITKIYSECELKECIQNNPELCMKYFVYICQNFDLKTVKRIYNYCLENNNDFSLVNFFNEKNNFDILFEDKYLDIAKWLYKKQKEFKLLNLHKNNWNNIFYNACATNSKNILKFLLNELKNNNLLEQHREVFIVSIKILLGCNNIICAEWLFSYLLKNNAIDVENISLLKSTENNKYIMENICFDASKQTLIYLYDDMCKCISDEIIEKCINDVLYNYCNYIQKSDCFIDKRSLCGYTFLLISEKERDILERIREKFTYLYNNINNKSLINTLLNKILYSGHCYEYEYNVYFTYTYLSYVSSIMKDCNIDIDWSKFNKSLLFKRNVCIEWFMHKINTFDIIDIAVDYMSNVIFTTNYKSTEKQYIINVFEEILKYCRYENVDDEYTKYLIMKLEQIDCYENFDNLKKFFILFVGNKDTFYEYEEKDNNTILEVLCKYTKFKLPENIFNEIQNTTYNNFMMDNYINFLYNYYYKNNIQKTYTENFYKLAIMYSYEETIMSMVETNCLFQYDNKLNKYIYPYMDNNEIKTKVFDENDIIKKHN